MTTTREFYDCPVNLITERVRGWLRMAAYHKADRVWFPGAVGQWPHKDTQAIGIVLSELQDIEEQKRERSTNLRAWKA